MSTKKLDFDKHAWLMRDAFNLVCDEKNWKNPIDAEVPWASASFYAEAVVFMTGSLPAFGSPYNTPHPVFSAPAQQPTRVVRMTAPGYYAAVGA